MTNTNNNITPSPLPVNPTALPGHVISTSCNVVMALSLIAGYLESTYGLQAADTKLEAIISNQEAAVVAAFEANNGKDSGGYYLYMLERSTTPGDLERYSNAYAAASAKNQAQTKVMDGNNSTAQNTLSQNSQGLQGLIQTMGSINSIGGNLSRLIQG